MRRPSSKEPSPKYSIEMLQHLVVAIKRPSDAAVVLFSNDIVGTSDTGVPNVSYAGENALVVGGLVVRFP